MKWYNKYLDLPYEHLGNDLEKGIDCFNLMVTIGKNELGEDLPMKSSDFCSEDVNWYYRFENPFKLFDEYSDIITKVDGIPQIYDIILLNIGASNVTNHCAMYVDNNKILNILENYKSRLSTYGNYYKNYTIGKYRWNKLIKN